jgi:hypothetical protein
MRGIYVLERGERGEKGKVGRPFSKALKTA